MQVSAGLGYCLRDGNGFGRRVLATATAAASASKSTESTATAATTAATASTIASVVIVAVVAPVVIAATISIALGWNCAGYGGGYVGELVRYRGGHILCTGDGAQAHHGGEQRVLDDVLSGFVAIETIAEQPCGVQFAVTWDSVAHRPPNGRCVGSYAN